MIASILEQALIALPLLMGAYMTLSLLKLPDFSLESAYLFGAVMACAAKELPLPLILLSSMLGGMTVGASVSLFNRYLNLPFLLAAIITNGLFHGITHYVLGTSVMSFHPKLPFSENTLFISVGTFVVLITGMVLRSQVGYSLAIYGNNPHFFASHNLSGNSVLICGVLCGHGCAGISGFLFAQAGGFVDLTMNFGIILLCLTGLILGKMVIKTQKPTLLVPLIGVVGYFCIQQTLLRVGLNLKYFNAFQALFVLTALAIGYRTRQTLIDHLGV